MADREGTINRLRKSLSVVKRWCRTDSLDDPIAELQCAMEDALKLLTTYQGVINQYRWERDTACDQLREIGKGLGEKMDDIVALLKEQEPEAVKPVKDFLSYRCGHCKHYVTDDYMTMLEMPPHEGIRYNYCPNCGRKVKWDEQAD